VSLGREGRSGVKGHVGDNTVRTRDGRSCRARLCAWLVGVQGLERAALAVGLFCTPADIIEKWWS